MLPSNMLNSFVIIITVLSHGGVSAVDNNIYMQLVHMTAKHANKTGCYVCGLIPHSVALGVPMMSVPIASKYNTADSDSKSELVTRPKHICDPEPINIALSLGPYLWCLKQNGSIYVGETLDCNTVINYHDKPVQNHTAMGVYWVCGNNAYSELPNSWSGICALGHLVPAMRITSILPDRVRYERSTDVFGTHHQSVWNRALGALIPTYGVMSALDQIGDLSKEVELLANSTALGLGKISEELTAVRVMALQNRAALDYILSAQGGTCKIIGIECCSYIPDNQDDLKRVISKINDVSRSAHEISPTTPGFLEWLSSYLGDLGKIVVEYIFLIILGLTVLALIIKGVKLIFVQLICGKTNEQTTQVVHYTKTPTAYII
ncbi:syncytin-1-like isoform X4 [Anguilla anguilla]|uniref:syncytin-1-like isoform X4 n=1 Tax=Anguilla anguilla TaxID=7936 RepID=UPI0015A81C3C|nr:syncytin-1-like isoform X4 [Anguilla anguilla]XP_035283241.1 syncytin-1-like isoform X4 [Anguilla anguilla]XP_035283242.1 syncytin-1-like isoform X4 [Anguilla anguilla]